MRFFAYSNTQLILNLLWSKYEVGGQICCPCHCLPSFIEQPAFPTVM